MRLLPRKHLIRFFITLACTAGVVGLFLSGFALFELFELKSFDLRFLSRGALPTSGNVVMAVIDEKSLATEGRWPWPRAKIARLVDQLSQDGARVIGFDIGFLEPDENSHLQLIDDIETQLQKNGLIDPGIKANLSQHRATADNDLLLANSINNASPAVVLSYFFHMDPDRIKPAGFPSQQDPKHDLIQDGKYPMVRMIGGSATELPVPTAMAIQTNIGPLAKVADGSGFFNKLSDADGVVRSSPLIIRHDQDLYAALAIQTVWHYLDRPNLIVYGAPQGVTHIQMGSLKIPTDEFGNLMINHLGPAKVIPTYSVTDIINGQFPADTFKDRIVLVGGAAMGIADYIITPFSTVAPGLSLHATIVENILSGNFIKNHAGPLSLTCLPSFWWV